MTAPSCLLRLLSAKHHSVQLQEWMQAAARPGTLSTSELMELEAWFKGRATETIFAVAFEELEDLRSRAAMLSGDLRRAISYVARCEQKLSESSTAADSEAVEMEI